ncbi:MAG: hypothetical protein JSU01_05315 [Bacteroidetes bacterium]|nr:hypothetical protein [Bacteroidota bacterium]
MKRLIIASVLLFAAVAAVTVVYFRHINTASEHTSLTMRAIPDDASLIFQFNNDKDFYDIFSGSKLFSNILGNEKVNELRALKKWLLQNSLLNSYLAGQDIFVSLHPQKNNTIDFLITVSVSKEFQSDVLELLYKQRNNGLLIHAMDFEGKQGYVIYLNDLKKRFYVISKDEQTISGSFSKEVIDDCAKYDYRKQKQAFVLLPDQESSSSLANLYINYRQLTPFAEQLFASKSPEMFKTLRQYDAFGALSLNFRNDALIFNGSSQASAGDGGYLGLFTHQEPVTNHLKEIFPSTTAYGSSFAVSDAKTFESDLADWEEKTDFSKERSAALAKVKKETGISLQKEFTELLGNEFAVITTHYREKIGLVQVKDGTKMLALLTNISKMTAENSGQFNYEKLPQILLGDAFSSFKRPFFRVIDNYLVMTGTESELHSYSDTYTNRKFLSKTEGYNDFNNLLAEQCSATFFIQFKNAIELFRETMKKSFYEDIRDNKPGWKNFYGASWQFTASEKSFYTNFSIGLKKDTVMQKDSL